jgi:hypothetical protein
MAGAFTVSSGWALEGPPGANDALPVVSDTSTPPSPPSQSDQPVQSAVAPVLKHAPQTPQTITVTTGGGSKIDSRVTSIFSKTTWRVWYPDAPLLETQANEMLANEGYDVAGRSERYGWRIQTIAIGNPEQYAPPGDNNEESKANYERAGRVATGFLVGLLTLGRAGSSIASGETVNSPNMKYITKDMVNGVPPGAKKILLTRVSNQTYRAQQEVLTVAYSDVSDDELRRLNAKYLFELLGIKLPISGDHHASN